MAPQLNDGELIWVSERSYRRRDPRRGEVVAARPAALGGKALVKRVAGIPRERIEVDGCAWELGGDEFFLAGDRRDDSLDSRRFGPVRREELVGRVQGRLWPWKWIVARPAEEG